MFQQTLTFYIQRPDAESLDEIVFRSSDGPILVDSTNVKRYNPQVPLSQVVGVVLRQEPYDADSFDPRALVQALPSERRAALVHYILAASNRAKAERARLTAAIPDNNPKETDDV